MIYIDCFKLPSNEEINEHFARNSFSVYPWTIFFQNGFEWVECKDITIFYGDNGSGKSTLLNLIAEKIDAKRETELFKEVFYDGGSDYHPFDGFVKSIKIWMAIDDIGIEKEMPDVRRLVTSDDIFSKIEERAKHNKRAEIEIEKAREKHDQILYKSDFKYRSLKDYDNLVAYLEAKKLTKSKYAEVHAPKKEQMLFNGQTALSIYSRMFETGGIYLLDEPENCLSSISQIELVKVLYESAKYYNCQFIICTHSPFILSIKDACIYNLDLQSVREQKWTELDNVKVYYEFFMVKKDEFDK